MAVYLRQRSPHVKLGAHGTSMGGMVATHLARKGLVDFLFADRTFSSLDEVPFYSMGNWAKWGMRIFTLWQALDSTEAYIFANCYKVIAQDPNDEVIQDNSSLKTGVALRIIENELKNLKMEKSFTGSKDKLSFKDYHHILAKEETYVLFTVLYQVFHWIFEFEVFNKKLRKEIGKIQRQQEMGPGSNQELSSNNGS